MSQYDLGTIAIMPAAPNIGAISLAQSTDVMLSADEARQIVKNINGRMDQCRKDLLELYDREGWRALGYDSWGACARAEFGSSAGTLYRQLEAAMIERDVLADSQVENPPPIPTTQLQAAKHLSSADRPKVFKRATELAGDTPRTAKHIAQAAAEIAAPDLPIDYSIVQRRLATHGVTLSYKDGTYTLADRGGAMSSTRKWDQVLDRLSLIEDAPAAPAPASISARSYDDREAADLVLIATAENAITHGDTDRARNLLRQVQVATWKRDQVLATITPSVPTVRDQAAAFLADQRDRLTRFSQSAMVSQTTFKLALDHIQALLELSE